MNQKRYIQLFSLDDLQEQKIEICLNDFQMFKKNEIKNRRPDLGLKGSLKRHQEKKKWRNRSWTYRMYILKFVQENIDFRWFESTVTRMEKPRAFYSVWPSLPSHVKLDAWCFLSSFQLAGTAITYRLSACQYECIFFFFLFQLADVVRITCESWSENHFRFEDQPNFFQTETITLTEHKVVIIF